MPFTPDRGDHPARVRQHLEGIPCSERMPSLHHLTKFFPLYLFVHLHCA